ncbi:hypothetical protein COLO4_23504 [Corchorus olitorius]|uniref:Sieve element occlusion n=1 Tax=Corchorus olitorius TaxID=93759 RepID=A0A1R3IG70_9ROSI|nr:hypothetical protein COLO4_23504 [Corchorus olitorius]
MTSFESGSFSQRSKLSLDDEILIKKLLLSHDPDGRRLDSEALLCAVENIMFHATASEVSDKPIDANLKSQIGNIELTGSQEPLMHTIYKIAYEMLCKIPGKEDLHTKTMVLFDMLGNYRWDAKMALALAAFATCYGEFCLIMQMRPHSPYAESVANFRQLPSDITILKPQFKALKLLIKTMVDLTRCIVEFEGLPIEHVEADYENIAAIKYSNITIAAWEISSLNNRLSGIYSHLRQLVDAFRQQSEAKLDQKLLNLLMESHADNQEVLRMLFALNDELPLKDCATQVKLGISEMKSKIVLLLVSKPNLLPLEQLFFLLHQTHDHPNKAEGSYAIIWVPISLSEKWTDDEKHWFNVLSSSMPFYSVRQPWSPNSAVIENLMKQVWHNEDEAIMVVLNLEGAVTNLNALDMVFIWGPEAYPYSVTREFELWNGEQWTLQLMTKDIHPILTQWVEEGRYICIYGSENLEWIREFCAKTKEIKNAGLQLEMIYVGKNNPNEHVKELVTIINREMHSTLLSFSKIQLFWLRLESMRRSKTRLEYADAAGIDHDHILAEVLALLHNNDENGWAVFGKGSSTNMVRVQGIEILKGLNIVRQWGEDVADLEFIGALRTVLEPVPFRLRGPCNLTKFVPYPDGEGSTEGCIVCQYCKRLMKPYTIYE